MGLPFLYLAKLLHWLRLLRLSLPFYRFGLKLSPDKADYWLGYGNAQVQLEQLQPALAAYTRAIDCKRDLGWAHYNLGYVSFRLGAFAEAERALQQAINLEGPHREWSYLVLVKALEQLDKDEEIESLYRRCVNQFERGEAVHFGFLSFLLRTRRLGEAERLLQKVLEINPHHLGALNNLICIYLHEKRIEEAMPLAKRLMSLRPTAPPDLLTLATFYKMVGDSKQAKLCADEASVGIKADAWWLRACLESVRGNVDQAIACLQKAREQFKFSAGDVALAPEFFWIRNDPRFTALINHKDEG